MLNTSHMRCFFGEELRHSFNALDPRVLHTHTHSTHVSMALGRCIEAPTLGICKCSRFTGRKPHLFRVRCCFRLHPDD